MRIRLQIMSALAIVISLASLCGCMTAYQLKTRPTAVPASEPEDPEQPSRPADYTGIIVGVGYDHLVLQPPLKRPRQADELGETQAPAVTATGTDQPRKVSISVPLTADARIRQSRTHDDGMEYVDISIDEVVPGQYATIWLDAQGVAEYVCISVRVRVKGDARGKG